MLAAICYKHVNLRLINGELPPVVAGKDALIWLAGEPQGLCWILLPSASATGIRVHARCYNFRISECAGL